jgi:molybdopterin-binding protein
MQYNHHPDPAIAFCIEVDILEGLYYDMRHGLPVTEDVPARAARALQFRVGGDAYAIAAKQALRDLIAAGR